MLKGGSKFKNHGFWWYSVEDKFLANSPENRELEHYKKHSQKDLIYFPSYLEKQTFVILRKYFGAKNVEIHPKVELIPGMEIVGKKPIDGIFWTIDFCAYHEASKREFYFEAKGYPTNDFKIKLRIFELMRLDLTLFLVSRERKRCLYHTPQIRLLNLSNFLEDEAFLTTSKKGLEQYGF